MDDEKYYQIVADELREKRINEALWTKSIAKSGGDDGKTKATYIQLRVAQLMQEEQRAREDAPAGGASWDEPEPQSASLAKIIVCAALVLLIAWAFKAMVWPKLQGYLSAE